MKRYKTLLVLPIAILMSVAAQAQQRSTTPTEAQQQDVQRRTRIQVEGAGAAGRQIEQIGQLLAVRQVGVGAWWTNQALVARLGITDEQKTKLDRAFENHRLRLTQSSELVDKEEASLAKLLEAEPVDRNAILTQTDRVIQARSELERVNSAMTLEMREVLTRAQWMQVPQPNAWGTATWSADVPVYYQRGGGGLGPATNAPRGRGRQQ